MKLKMCLFMYSYLFVLPSPAEFSIWTREAGAGGLSIAVEGPSKAEISFEDRKDGSCGVSYIVKEPGRTFLNPQRWNFPHLIIFCLETDKLFTKSSELPPVHVMVQINNLSAPPGDYEVSIKFNNEQIPDSPFIVPIATLSDEARRLTVTSLQVRSETLAHTHTHARTHKIHVNLIDISVTN